MAGSRGDRQESLSADAGVGATVSGPRVPRWPEPFEDLRLREHVPEIERVVGAPRMGDSPPSLLHATDVGSLVNGILQLALDGEHDLDDLGFREVPQLWRMRPLALAMGDKFLHHR